MIARIKQIVYIFFFFLLSIDTIFIVTSLKSVTIDQKSVQVDALIWSKFRLTLLFTVENQKATKDERNFHNKYVKVRKTNTNQSVFLR